MTACISHSKSGRNPLVLPLKLNPTFAELLHGYIIFVWSPTQEISIFSLESQWCHNRSRARVRGERQEREERGRKPEQRKTSLTSSFLSPLQSLLLLTSNLHDFSFSLADSGSEERKRTTALPSLVLFILYKVVLTIYWGVTIQMTHT